MHVYIHPFKFLSPEQLTVRTKPHIKHIEYKEISEIYCPCH